jgi:2,3-bisphosphoglycerate-independent phosphoglycerate mutase
MNSKRKYVVLLGDGMADYPIESLGNITPLEAARTPNMDYIASNGISGLVDTIPEGMAPGSDTANLSLFGYDPKIYYTGRAPLEALSMGIEMGDKDAAFRCNIVTLEDNIMKDFSGGHIDTEFSKIVMEELAENIRLDGIEYYPGVSYRNTIIWRNYPYGEITGSTPPHDIHDKIIDEHLPTGDGSELILDLMKRSEKIIRESPRIRDAASRYQGKPVSAWIWGGGRKPAMKTLNEMLGLSGYTISAVDLIHGIGKAAGLEAIHVDGATGYIDTNYEGKAKALLESINRANFIYLHVESPDESGHEGNLEHKIKAIEDFDSRIVGPVLEGLKKYEDYTILVTPDHPTPLKIRTHTSDPVPFAIYRNRDWKDQKNLSAKNYSEKSAKETGLLIGEGHRLLKMIVTEEF